MLMKFALCVMTVALGFGPATPALSAQEKPKTNEKAAPTFLKRPEQSKANVAASPKLDARVHVCSAEPISGTIADHRIGADEVVFGLGARDGVRFGQAFQVHAAGRAEVIGIAKVMELNGERCVAKVVSLDRDDAERSLKGLTVVCAAPNIDRIRTTIESRIGRNIWQTESLENKIIRGLLESSRGSPIVVVQEDRGGTTDR